MTEQTNMQTEGETIKRIPTTGVVLLRQDPDNSEVFQALLVRHGESAGHPTDTYGTPGGRINENETSLQAAVRELEEETGLIIRPEDLKKLPKIYNAELPRKNGVLHVTHIVYVGTKFEGELTPEEDTSYPEWVDINKMSKLNLGVNIEDMVHQAQKLLE